MSRTLKNLAELQLEFDKNHSGKADFFETISDENIESLEHAIVCIAGELGELANLAKKVKRGDFEYKTQRKEIIDEVTDIFIYTLKLANQIGFDLEEAYLSKLKKNTHRFRKYEK